MNWPAHGMVLTTVRTRKPRSPTVERPLVEGDPIWLAADVASLLSAWRGAGLLSPAAVIGVGIDPGRGGALALVLRVNGVVRGASVFPLPVQADPTQSGRAKRKAIDGRELWRWLRLLGGEATCNATVRLVMEKHQIIPGHRGAEHHEQSPGAAAGFAYGTARSALTAGKISGQLEALAVERVVVVLAEPAPRPWRDAIGLLAGGDKDYLLERARAIYPQLASRLTAKAHHDRAEALLLATYALDAPC